IYNATTSYWYILKSTTGYASGMTISWGGTGYTPVAGQDFDGDKKTDLTIYQQSSGNWYVLKSSTSYTTSLTVNWGCADCILVPGDYDGDGMADVAVFRRFNNQWLIRTSSSGFASLITKQLGGVGTVPVSGYDFDGDLKADIAIYIANP